MEQLAQTLEKIVGSKGLLAGDDISDAYRYDAARYRRGEPSLVVRPASTEEVSKVLAACNEAGQPVSTQGGMTGLADGAVPQEGEVALSLSRMRNVDEFDASAATISVQSGVPLGTVQDTADENGFFFPLDLGARGSCTIGGNLSTNAGGNRVLRYGMMRDLTLGVEAVLADGTIVDSRCKTIKNNTGYDLKQLFIGSEGTLGVITGAVLRLFAKPRSQSLAFCALPNFDAVIRFLHFASARLGGDHSAFEVLWPGAYDGVLELVKTVKPALPAGHGFYVLVEALGGDPESDTARFEAMLEAASNEGLVEDAAVAKSQADVQDLWAIRDGVPEAIFAIRPIVNYDISIPLGEMERITNEIDAALDKAFPGHRTFYFGHIGDGNLHVSSAVGGADAEHRHAIDELVFERTASVNGSISAEHGVGFARREHLGKSRSPAELTLMRSMKAALDPNNILNPGRILKPAN